MRRPPLSQSGRLQVLWQGKIALVDCHANLVIIVNNRKQKRASRAQSYCAIAAFQILAYRFKGERTKSRCAPPPELSPQIQFHPRSCLSWQYFARTQMGHDGPRPHHHVVGHVLLRLVPRATSLCQAKANTASRIAPTPTGATRKVQDMSLTTTTNGSIPAGG